MKVKENYLRRKKKYLRIEPKRGKRGRGFLPYHPPSSSFLLFGSAPFFMQAKKISSNIWQRLFKNSCCIFNVLPARKWGKSQEKERGGRGTVRKEGRNKFSWGLYYPKCLQLVNHTVLWLLSGPFYLMCINNPTTTDIGYKKSQVGKNTISKIPKSMKENSVIQDVS